MSDISKIKVPNGTVYDLKDETARSALAGKAAASHSHTISQISDFPASLPANSGNADSCNCAKYLGTFGGSGEYYGSSLPMRCVYNKFGDLKFALTTDTDHEIRVDYATDAGTHATGIISDLSNNVSVTMPLSFTPAAVLFFNNYNHLVNSGFSLVIGTNQFVITPSSVSAMSTTTVRFLAFRG